MVERITRRGIIRLIATVGDMDQNALDWAMATESEFSSENGELVPLLGASTNKCFISRMALD